MKPLPIVLIFSGYALIYAAVAAGGKFATEPWAGLFADAYTETFHGQEKAKPVTNLQGGPALKGMSPNTGRGVRTRGISTPVTPGPGR